MRLLTISLIVFTFFNCESQVTTTKEDSTVQMDVQDVDVLQFQQLMEKENSILLDVRTPKEIAAGKIEGALEIDVLAPDFMEKIKQLDQEATYLVYCKAGGRSAKACTIMKGQGFKKLHNLKGGYTEWIKASEK